MGVEELIKKKKVLECIHPKHRFVVLPQDSRHTTWRHTSRLQVLFFESAAG
jgi:hypothetical protein